MNFEAGRSQGRTEARAPPFAKVSEHYFLPLGALFEEIAKLPEEVFLI